MAVDYGFNSGVDEEQDEAVLDPSLNELPVNVSQLSPINAEEQAASQLSDNVPVEPEVVTEGNPYPGPKKGTTSAVDLSQPGAEEAMWDEYKKIFKMDRNNPSREVLEDAWYRKYYGKTLTEIKEERRTQGGFYPGANDPIGNLKNTFQGLSSFGLGLVDFGMDFVGALPGGAPLDNKWDQVTRLDNPVHQGIRRISSVVIPSMITGKAIASKLPAVTRDMPRLQKLLVGMGAYGVEQAAIIGISDEGEEHNALRVLHDVFPGVFGEKGFLPIPDWAKTLDSDSPSVRRYKNMYENAGLSVFGTTLGAFIELKGNKSMLSWMDPLDNTSAAYKTREISKASNPDKLIRINELNDELVRGVTDKKLEAKYIDELETLKESLGNIEDLEDALRISQTSTAREVDNAARAKIDNGANPDDFDPDINPVLSEADSAKSTVPPANVARNMADTTAIKMGVSQGDPAPVITEAMRRKGLMVDNTSRDAVLGVAEEARDTGRFNALVDGFRFSSKQMDAAAWNIYESIIAAENIDDLKGLFLRDKDVKNLLNGKFKIEYINEEQARGAAFALRDLTDRYTGRAIANASARVMDTLGREATTLSQAILELKPFVSEPKVMDLIIDKMQFLMDEYALNKYISGWQLRNKNWFDSIPPDNIDEAIKEITKSFKAAEKSIHSKNLGFTKALIELSETNPLMMRGLVDAWAHTRGDVDSIAKLNTWAMDQLTPLGLIKSPNPKELNLFARSAWGVVYNNVLSGISAFRAALGNTSQLMLKPITQLLGHGLFGITDGFNGFTRTMYYHGAVFETNKRALSDAWQMMKKAHKDPELMMKAYRKDFVFQDDVKWGILEDLAAGWRAEGNEGKLMLYDMTTNLRDFAKIPALRYGMTGMVFPDVFTWTHLAHQLSRVRAYDDVFSEFGFADWKKIAVAEKKHYSNFFDSKGLINDDVLKSYAGEVSLNLDDSIATWINQGTTAVPAAKVLMMFPRTQSNVVKNALSWTPISLIPGINKYSKTIWARTDDDIAQALIEHGIDMASTPNAKAIFQNLRAEYTGRIAFSSLLTKNLWDYAMAGNIRGNGHYSADRRKKERDQFGYEPKTINIAGKWVSYKGILGVEQVLSILGDLSYYAADIDAPLLEDWHSKVMWTLSAAFLNETPLQGIEPLVAISNADLTGFNRLVANTMRMVIPASSGLGVLAKAIDGAQKDIQGEIHEYLLARLPGLSFAVPNQIDIWTGEPLNDIDNPFLKMLNAVSPIKVSGTSEPWRIWLQQTGWRGLARLKKHSSGTHEYTTGERELIYASIGKMQLYKQLIPLMNDKKMNKELKLLRAHRATGQDLDSEELSLKTEKLPVIRAINAIVKQAQITAEAQLEATEPSITEKAIYQGGIDEAMTQGDVNRANQLQKKHQLLQYGGSR